MNENIYIKKKITTFSSFLACYELNLGFTTDKKLKKIKKTVGNKFIARARLPAAQLIEINYTCAVNIV